MYSDRKKPFKTFPNYFSVGHTCNLKFLLMFYKNEKARVKAKTKAKFYCSKPEQELHKILQLCNTVIRLD
jgi:hypothetical protein